MAAWDRQQRWTRLNCIFGSVATGPPPSTPVALAPRCARRYPPARQSRGSPDRAAPWRSSGNRTAALPAPSGRCGLLPHPAGLAAASSSRNRGLVIDPRPVGLADRRESHLRRRAAGPYRPGRIGLRCLRETRHAGDAKPQLRHAIIARHILSIGSGEPPERTRAKGKAGRRKKNSCKNTPAGPNWGYQPSNQVPALPDAPALIRRVLHFWASRSPTVTDKRGRDSACASHKPVLTREKFQQFTKSARSRPSRGPAALAEKGLSTVSMLAESATVSGRMRVGQVGEIALRKRLAKHAPCCISYFLLPRLVVLESWKAICVASCVKSFVCI